MKEILVINTGGTFNKVYNPLTGNLEISKDKALKSITKHWLTKLNIINIIGKDSLEMTDEDREEIHQTIKMSNSDKILIVHGTDTIHLTANYLDSMNLNKSIILTGAMVPYSIDPIEATANFASAYGYLCAVTMDGIYIGMNGVIEDYKKVNKNKEKGYFETSKEITLS